MTELQEYADRVSVEVVTTTRDVSDACLDELRVELRDPLGRRGVVDLTSGASLTVAPERRT